MVVLPTDSEESKSGEGFACRQCGAGNYRGRPFSLDTSSKSHRESCCKGLSEIFSHTFGDGLPAPSTLISHTEYYLASPIPAVIRCSTVLAPCYTCLLPTIHCYTFWMALLSITYHTPYVDEHFLPLRRTPLYHPLYVAIRLLPLFYTLLSNTVH